jgi:hypothetical protein
MLQIEASLKHTKQYSAKLSTTLCFTSRTERKYATITITKLGYFYSKPKNFNINTALVTFCQSVPNKPVKFIKNWLWGRFKK